MKFNINEVVIVEYISKGESYSKVYNFRLTDKQNEGSVKKSDIDEVRVYVNRDYYKFFGAHYLTSIDEIFVFSDENMLNNAILLVNFLRLFYNAGSDNRALKIRSALGI